MSEPSESPRQVFEQFLQTIASRRWTDLLAFYADDAVVEQPFELPAPRRLQGHDQLAAHFSGASTLPFELEVRHLVVHQTDDPEVVVGEFDYLGRITTTGRTFTVANIIVMRVRDGKIVESRDYHNHAVLAEALAGVANGAPAASLSPG
jgi:ketosteroid isomerase-like protein